MKYFRLLTISLLSVTLFGSGSCYSQMRSSVVDHDYYTPVVKPHLPESLDFAGEAVPLDFFDVRESLQREMLVTLYMHSRTYLVLLNSKRYFSLIEPILRKNGIPEDFKYLCVAESGLNPEVVSPAGAAGLWQIMPATGREHGLSVGKEVDERYDIEKATEVACAYLKEAYEQFGSWTLAAASYNLGQNGLSRRLTKQGVNDYYNAFMPQETLRYVYRILSYKLLMMSPGDYGYRISDDDLYKELVPYRTVDITAKSIDWSAFARDNGTTYKMLRQLNHWIRDYEYESKTEATFTVKIPEEGFRDIK